MTAPTLTPGVPLSAVAPDMRALVAAFRAAGEPGFQHQSVATARDTYLTSCLANGLPPAAMANVHDHDVQVSGGTLTLRAYTPPDALPGAAVMFLHGGGWVLGSTRTHDSLCRALAAQSGLRFFSVDYRLAPEHPHPVPVQDCAAALAWLIAQASGLGLDPARLAICGDSAGGALAATLANDAGLRPRGFQFLAQALLYPVTDLRGESGSYARISAGFSLSAPTMHWFRDHYAAGQDLSDPRLSPLLSDTPAALPAFLVTCGLDPLCDEGLAYGARLTAAGAALEHHHLPAHAHGIFTLAGKIDTAAQMIGHIGRFLRAQALTQSD